MLKQILILLIICFSSFCVLAQTEKYTAPVKWERYKVGDKDVSVLLPKLPGLIRRSNACLQQETNQYAVYADEIIYGLTITSKSNIEIPSYCRRNGFYQKGFFVEDWFEDRLKEIKAQLKTFDETKFSQDNREIIKIKSVSESYTYWLINDFNNKKLYELWITGKDDEKKEVKNFVESININKNAQGIEIGEGSSRTLGDENVADTTDISAQDKSAKETEKEEIQNIKIILKPFASYTDKARNAQTQGTVRLKVTFSANGGIKTVAVEKELKDGLTEQAIAAAMKIVFFPAKKNGKPYSVSKLVDYSFTIF
ncbi:MAG: energy transducer TonB [Acidobacteriota bacterium]|nr:energy transducer TonB [Acidobacteriota bacterium]